MVSAWDPDGERASYRSRAEAHATMRGAHRSTSPIADIFVGTRPTGHGHNLQTVNVSRFPP